MTEEAGDEPSNESVPEGTDVDNGDERNEDRETTVESNGVTTRYVETEDERLLTFERGDRTAAIAQNRSGYAMVAVRRTADGDELERYYALDVALDHVAELLDTSPHELPVPAAGADIGM